MIPIRNEDYDCLDGLFATICSNNDREYYMGFASKLYFRCLSKYNTSIEECLSLFSFDYVSQALEQAHGVKITQHVYFGKERLREEIISGKSHNIPISLKVDIYDCPWSILYHKYHIEHEIIVLDEFDGVLKCIDPYLSDDILEYKIPVGQSMFECKKYSFIPHQEKAEICMWIMKKNLFIYNQIIDQNFTNLIALIRKMEAKDIDVENIDSYYFNRRITTLGHNRGCYIIMLENLSKKYGHNYSEEIQQLRYEKDLFRIVHSIIIKGLMKGNLDQQKDKICERLADIYVSEKKMITGLIDKISFKLLL